MGVWFLSGVLGNYFAGVMGSFWEPLPKVDFWLLASVVPAVAGMVVLSLRRFINRIILEQEALDSLSAPP
jgi:POT family proton-dependent oligopeptide transporter